ncbi:hypothetical protein Csa_021103 [Cucumis sativus]|nr:hypothetical protein Csa_021103 [Cucumis sativus]
MSQYFFYTCQSDGKDRIKSVKKFPRWSYKLIKEIEQVYDITDGELVLDYQIRSRKCKRVVILSDLNKIKKISTSTSTNEIKSKDEPKDEPMEQAIIRYAKQWDFRREIIKGSMRAQRRKMVHDGARVESIDSFIKGRDLGYRNDRIILDRNKYGSPIERD